MFAAGDWVAIGFPLKIIAEPFMGAKVEINSLCLSMAEERKREGDPCKNSWEAEVMSDHEQ